MRDTRLAVPSGPGPALARRSGPFLAPVERATLALIADGLTNAAIAERLDVTEETVKSTLRRVRHKVGVTARPALVDTAYRNRQLPAPAVLERPEGVDLDADQQTLLRLLASGAATGQIATATYQSAGAVKARLASLLTALGADTAAQAVHAGWTYGYLTHDPRPEDGQPHPTPLVSATTRVGLWK